MPIIRINGSSKRDKKIKEVLPEKPITEDTLLPALKSSMTGPLLKALKQEIAVYKAFPKDNAKPDKETFDPRNNRTCFMGQGFYANGQGAFESWQDADLVTYRKAVGTLSHPVWGNCTLLEIWGADHFTDYPDMVKGVWEYAYGKRKKLPVLQFAILPFPANPNAKWRKNEQDKAEEVARENLVEVLVEKAYSNGYRDGKSGKSPRKAITPTDHVEDDE